MPDPEKREQTPFERFEEAARRLFKVSKEEVEKAERGRKKEREAPKGRHAFVNDSSRPRVGAWVILAVEAWLYGLTLLMAMHAFAPGEDDTWAIVVIAPPLVVPAILLTILRTRVLKLRLGKKNSATG